MRGVRAVVLGLAVMVGGLITPIADAATIGTPAIGYVDLAAVRGAGFELRGWALDPARPSASSAVDVTVSTGAGTTRQRYTANRSRPDVATALRVKGDHGFVLQIALQPDITQRVCVFSLSSTTATPAVNLGCFDATPEANSPVGAVDSIRNGWMGGSPAENLANNGLTFKGWAVDRDAAGAPLALRLDDITPSGSVFSSMRLTGVPRPDVVASVPGASAAAGFDVTMALKPEVGTHTVCVYVVNVGAGSDSVIGCTKAVVMANPPIGNIDTITLTRPGTVDVTGWAIDPTTPRSFTSLSVALKQTNGIVEGGGSSVAPFSRPDVAVVYPWAGADHGFDLTMSTYRGGTYTLCMRAGTSNNQNLAIVECEQVYVPDVVGYLDSVVTKGDQVTVTGWVFDPAHPDVAVGATGTTKYDIGGWPGTVTVENRPDVGAALHTSDNKGFTYTFSRVGLPAGTQMCFRAGGADIRIKGIDCITL